MAVKTHFAALLFILASAFLLRRVTSLEEYKLGVLLPYNYDMNREYPPAEDYASAITVAVEKVNSDPTLLKGATLSYVWNNTACNQTKMVEQQHWQIKQGVVGFVGPSCHGRKAAKIAEKHDLAVVSFDCQDTHVSNKKLFPNFARTNPQHSKAAFKILAHLKASGLKRVNIVYQDNHKLLPFKRFLSRLLRRSDVKIASSNKVDLRTFYLGPLPNFLYILPSTSQATILVTSFGIAREIMYHFQAYLENNTTPILYSKHIFISVPLENMNRNVLYPFKWFFSEFKESTPERMNMTQRAFKKLLVVSDVIDQETNEFRVFEQELKKKASGKPWFSKTYQGCLFLGETCIFDKSTSKIPLKGAYLYDAVIQFAAALHELREAGQKTTGKNIVNRLKGRHFIGADGHQHKFDENADVVYDYTVLGLTRDKNNELNMLPMVSYNRILEKYNRI